MLLFFSNKMRAHTLEQIQLALYSRTTLSGIATHLRNNYINSTESLLTAISSFYDQIREDNQL
ncbi:hypothetical protein SAMN05661096_00067 [Marivirga sericea]|uniref:Uncharacterized protein n=1 Tax=Marivirga sericea TaxID=1028 RepID=A0A1X7I152_9BACT|nr:hypothetical protein SAMN05661096_00067 [Marivirga sericea]